ncbi:MAG: Fe-S cluster assembly sulfur transfer protein SufU [Candidatus Nanoarchaeia archaeon]
MSHSLYSEIILDYYRNPKQKGKVENANLSARDTNPACGDVIEFTAFVDGDLIKDVKFDGKGCAISLSAASMIAEYLVGKNIDEVSNMKKDDILDMLGIPISGIRLKCALLGLKVVKMGAYELLGKEMEDDPYETPKVETAAPASELELQIREKLKLVEDPELHMDVVTLGLIRTVRVIDAKAQITMTLTSPMCPFGPQLIDSVKQAAKMVEGVKDVDVTLEFTPPWEPPENVKMVLGV